MAPSALILSYASIYEVGAILACLVGSHSSLLLAAAGVHLGLRKLMVISAFQFSVQSIFCLHFISMCGIRLGVEWGFDIGFTLISFALVASFGTAALTIILFLRQSLEPKIKEEFLGYGDDKSFATSLYVLIFILRRISYVKLTSAIILLVIGAAGCHHVGMWSIHALQNGPHVMSRINFWSLLITAGIGGSVCVLIALSFLALPQGLPGLCLSLVLTAGIAAFHFTSATWGMNYILGEEGMTTTFVMNDEVVIVFILTQGLLSQLITAIFSQLSIEHHQTAEKQLTVAQLLGSFIAAMDLEPAKQIRAEREKPSMLEDTLFQIVENLELYRPYLPDTLFAVQHHAEDEPDEKDLDSPIHEDDPDNSSFQTRKSCRSSTSAISRRYGSQQQSADNPLRTPRNSQHGACIAPSPPIEQPFPASASQLHSTAWSPRCPSRGFDDILKPPPRIHSNMTVGLQPSQVAILRMRLSQLTFGGGRNLNQEVVQEQLQTFMGLFMSEVRRHNGTIVTCASATAMAIWNTLSPITAVETALAIQQKSQLPVVMVVQCSRFLIGNLGSDNLRAFNVVGPMEWEGQQLLRLGNGQSHVFITTNEWQAVHLKFTCLPFERVLMDGNVTTVYTVTAKPFTSCPKEDEWMYEVADNLQQIPLAQVDVCWRAYIRGKYHEMRERSRALIDVAAWYPLHLQSLADVAAGCNASQPTKSLENLGWPNIPPLCQNCESVLSDI